MHHIMTELRGWTKNVFGNLNHGTLIAIVET